MLGGKGLPRRRGCGTHHYCFLLGQQELQGALSETLKRWWSGCWERGVYAGELPTQSTGGSHRDFIYGHRNL